MYIYIYICIFVYIKLLYTCLKHNVWRFACGEILKLPTGCGFPKGIWVYVYICEYILYVYIYIIIYIYHSYIYIYIILIYIYIFIHNIYIYLCIYLYTVGVIVFKLIHHDMSISYIYKSVYVVPIFIIIWYIPPTQQLLSSWTLHQLIQPGPLLKDLKASPFRHRYFRLVAAKGTDIVSAFSSFARQF